QFCINAKFEHQGHTFYAIQTFDGQEYGFQVLGLNGTLSMLNYTTMSGKPLSFLSVAWTYSPVFKSLVAIAFQDVIYRPSDHDKLLKTVKVNANVNGNGVQVAFVNPLSGQVRPIVDVHGYAFLECAAATN